MSECVLRMGDSFAKVGIDTRRDSGVDVGLSKELNGWRDGWLADEPVEFGEGKVSCSQVRSAVGPPQSPVGKMAPGVDP